jgi:hypothetical protein
MDNSISLVKISKGYYFPSHFFSIESNLLKLFNVFPSKIFLTFKVRKHRGNLPLNQEEFFDSLLKFLSTRINSIYTYYIMSDIMSSEGTFGNKLYIAEHSNQESLSIYYSNETFVMIILFNDDKDRELFLSEWALLKRLEQE